MKLYVDNSIHETSLVRYNTDNDFKDHNITNMSSITLNTQAGNENHVITNCCVIQFQQENERSRRDLRIDFYDESNDLVKKTR